MGDPKRMHAVLVSGFGRDYHIPGLHTWFPLEVDFTKVVPKATEWRVLHARADYLVPYREGQWLATQLDTPLVTTKRVGHLIDVEGVKELPEVLDAALSII